ncbi:MAG: CDP-alcohol phosphatidyltransferase family protein [Deltaproteobacteria bacterium]|nr:CDP-alcohol phosphatidyltransferase family protein [Deltaproteobacteria bacterium]MBW2400961.1 CDP-alcohol phosphatidyltransferase family protein [Deltaproteobacteria bacterium]
MIKEKFGDRLDDWIHAALPFLFRRKVDPNLLTVVGALISLLAAAAFAAGWFVIGGVGILAGGFFDLIDGVVARHHGTTTRFGAFLDSTLDRLVDMALLLGIALHFARVGRPEVVLLAGVALIACVLVSYSKACAEQYVPEIKVGIMERGERVGLLAVGGILGMVVPALWVVAIGSSVTVIQRFDRAYKEMQKADAADRAGLGEQP